MRLAARLHADPLRKLERSPRHPSHNWGYLLLKGEGREGDRKRGREGQLAFHTNFRP